MAGARGVCYCETCEREIHRLGIGSHRAAHRRRRQDCRIVFSGGRTRLYRYSQDRETKEAR